MPQGVQMNLVRLAWFSDLPYWLTSLILLGGGAGYLSPPRKKILAGEGQLKYTRVYLLKVYMQSGAQSGAQLKILRNTCSAERYLVGRLWMKDTGGMVGAG